MPMAVTRTYCTSRYSSFLYVQQLTGFAYVTVRTHWTARLALKPLVAKNEVLVTIATVNKFCLKLLDDETWLFVKTASEPKHASQPNPLNCCAIGVKLDTGAHRSQTNLFRRCTGSQG